jgi:hypothetical protein
MDWMATLGEVIGTVLCLASPGVGFTIGQALPLDGGARLTRARAPPLRSRLRAAGRSRSPVAGALEWRCQ